jgi:predicted acyltransferase
MKRETNMTQDISPQASTQRLLSLDFFRGLTMLLLIGKSSGLYHLLQTSDVGFLSFIGFQFEHHPWNGLTFWDFVEPFFMFIVGVAIPFSALKRLEKGDPWKKILMHALQRSLTLFMLGIIYYSISAGRPVWKLWNVLTQLGFTYLVAFLLMRKPIKVQVAVSFAFLFVSEMLYRFWPVEGFNQGFVPAQNFGAWFDLQIMGMTEKGYWVAFNAVPTAAFTIWGVVAGLILRSVRTPSQKLKILFIAGLVGIVVGFALNPITPIIKRIATSSYVIETGGWCLVAIAFSYWMVDLKKIQIVPKFFAIVGMNCLFIYLYDQFGGASLLIKIAKPFMFALFFWSPGVLFPYATAFAAWFLLWYMCYWLYKNKILIKI